MAPAIEKKTKQDTLDSNVLLNEIKAIKASHAQIAENQAKLEKKLDEPVYAKGRTPAHLFHATSGPVGKDSAGYSVLKMAAFCAGFLKEEECKEEIAIHNRLLKLYKGYNYTASKVPHKTTMLVPFDSRSIPAFEPEGEKLALEVRQKMAGSVYGFDPDEAHDINSRMGGHFTKALGTITDTAAGVLVGFPTLMELVDLQRNLEVFPNAGATEIALPANGRMQFPKLTGGATAYFVGEAAAITQSQPTTGSLTLEAKKLGILVPMNNELLRFANPTAEAMVRMDMARVAARKADLSMLSGTGGTEIKGLLTYPTQTTWTEGTDSLILHVAKTVGANGNTFEVEDVALMEGKLPDSVEPTAWVFRRDYFANIMNRRADAANTGDRTGPFMFWTSRGDAEKGAWPKLWDTKVVRSAQVSNARTKGSASNLTYNLCGYFPDWIIARAGVVEFLANQYGDTVFAQDQTLLRAIQLLDAGARHAASFVLCDTLINS